jgi:PhnB protein
MAKDPKIPAQYQTVMPYLIVKNAAKFIAFMENVFSATETYKVKRDENTIMHGEIMIGESTIMFADATDQYKSQTAGMFIYVDNADERYKKAIEAGATIITQVSDQPYGRSGGVADPFGNTWWITSLK